MGLTRVVTRRLMRGMMMGSRVLVLGRGLARVECVGGGCVVGRGGHWSLACSTVEPYLLLTSVGGRVVPIRHL